MQVWKVLEDRGLLFCLTLFLAGINCAASPQGSHGLEHPPGDSLGEMGLLTRTRVL